MARFITDRYLAMPRSPPDLVPMNSMRAAVIGTGFIGPVHVEALRRAGIEVAAVIGSIEAKSRDAAKQLGIDPKHATLADVLADDSIDSVHITTPNQFHFDQARDVLSAGKHVLCEKPLAMDSRQSAELVDLAARTGRAAAVAYNLRFYPLCHEAASRIQAGTLGRITHVTGSYVQDWLLHDTDFNWRVSSIQGGPLRAVADIGTHWLDLVQFVVGSKIVSVCADLQTVHPTRRHANGTRQTFTSQQASPSELQLVEIDTEDAGSVMLRFENGAHGSLWVSQTTAGRKNSLRFEIAGTSQAISFDSENPNQLWIGHRDRPNEILSRDPALISPSAGNICSYPGGHNEGFADTFKQLIRRFYGYIAGDDFSAPKPFPTFADGHHEMVLCEAILESDRTRAWVNLENEP